MQEKEHLDIVFIIKDYTKENFQLISPFKELKVVDQFELSVYWLVDNRLFNLLIDFLKFDIMFIPCDIWTTSVLSTALY